MTEEEKKAIKDLKHTLKISDELFEEVGDRLIDTKSSLQIKTLLNLIEKQQAEIDRIKEYSHQEIVHYTETIKDYIDDGKEENKDFIGELKEEREHWKDIERILQDEPNEQLYMDWWKYGLYE